MLALKLTLVPLSLLIVSMSGKWWGPAIAGWLSSLPVITGPILYLLVLAHGAEFGANAATHSLSAIFALEAFSFAYAWTCRSAPWPIAISVGLASWLAAASMLSLLPASPAWAIAAASAGIAVSQLFLPRSAVAAKGAAITRTDLAGRMIAGAVLTLAVTSLSGIVGPGWSGLLAVFPLFGTVLSVSSHRAHGPDFVVSLLRGMVLGKFSFAAFCLLLSLTLPYQATILAFVEAATLAIFTQWSTKRLALERHI